MENALQCRFYLEALQDLHSSLAAKGSGLYFSLCSPAEGLSRLTQQLSAEASELQLFHNVYSGPARVAEEDAAAAAFREAAGDTPCSIHSSWGHTLYHPHTALQALAQQKSSRKKKHDSVTDHASGLPVSAASDAAQLTRDTSLFEAIPGVMTDFRKVCCNPYALAGIIASAVRRDARRAGSAEELIALLCHC